MVPHCYPSEGAILGLVILFTVPGELDGSALKRHMSISPQIHPNLKDWFK